jgi:hypothetical protein
VIDQDHRCNSAGSDTPHIVNCEVVSNLGGLLGFGTQGGGSPDVASSAEADCAFVRTARLHSKQMVKSRNAEDAARRQLQLKRDIPQQLSIQMTEHPLRFVQNLNQLVLGGAAPLYHGQKPRTKAIGLGAVGHFLLAIVVLASGQ